MSNFFDDLLKPDYGDDDSPPDLINVCQFILYFSEEEFAEFKALAKEAMRRELPDTYRQSNASDILLLVLRKYYGNENLNIKKEIDGTPGQRAHGEVSG